MAFRDPWDFPALEEFVESRGDVVVHEVGVACPCRNSDHFASAVRYEQDNAAQAKFGCSKCQGDGMLYRSARCIRGLITSINSSANRELLEMGYAVKGDMVLSPSFKAGLITDLDKITLTHSTPINAGQNIRRNAAQLEDNAMLDNGLESNEDRLWYHGDCALHCEDINGSVYTQGADFVFDGHKIRWVGSSPADNTLYTVKYTAFLEWIAWTTPHERYDHGRTLAQKVVLRKKHVSILSGSKAYTAQERSDEEEEFTTRTLI